MTQSDAPVTAPGYRGMLAVVIILTVMIVLAVGALIGGALMGLAGPRVSASGPFQTALAAPGQHIESAQLEGNRILLRLSDGEAEEIVVLDAGSGRVLGRVVVDFQAVTARILELSDELAASVLAAAARAYPKECCGLLEGVDTDQGWRAIAVHETSNIAPDPEQRFLIDPQAQFNLMRRLRGSEQRIVGCFHSHPDGRAEPSATDRAGAYESGFLYLIAGGGPYSAFTLAAFVFSEGQGFSPVALP